MEEKESPLSGSPSNSPGSESPAPSGAVPQLTNMALNMSLAGGMGGGGGGGSIDLFGRKKRGRPRKYDSEGNLRYQPPPQPPGFSLSAGSPPSSDFSSGRRGRGRPPGSGNWQLLASLGELFADTAGGDFTPHVVTVQTGEDVASKILSFSQKGPRGICVLSANGAVSNVTIRQPGSSGGILTYEGRFEILSLSGSFTVTDAGGVRSRSGGLSVSLAGPDGRVIGGGIAGLLTAASPIQIVVGSFVPNGYKVHKRKHYREPPTTPIALGTPDTLARPVLQVAPHVDSCPAPASQFLGQSRGETTTEAGLDGNRQIPTAGAVWSGPETASDQRPSPDINVSLLGD